MAVCLNTVGAEPPLPDEPRLREIVAEKYSPDSFYIGGTTGWEKRASGPGEFRGLDCGIHETQRFRQARHLLFFRLGSLIEPTNRLSHDPDQPTIPKIGKGCSCVNEEWMHRAQAFFGETNSKPSRWFGAIFFAEG